MQPQKCKLKMSIRNFLRTTHEHGHTRQNLYQYSFLRHSLSVIFAALLVFTISVSAQTPLKQGHPDRYTVKKGDTLWDLANLFLDDPWRWPLIWKYNPQIENPHLIYPGDLLVVTGDGMLKAVRNGRPGGSTRLVPRIRRDPREKAIPTIPPNVIQPFLNSSLIVDDRILDSAGHVVIGTKDELILGKHQQFYARKLRNQSAYEYRIFRIGDRLVHPNTSEFLGIEAIHVGDAVMLNRAKVAKLQVIDSVREIVPGDRLIPADDKPPLPYYYPHAPQNRIKAWIIRAPSGVREVGRYDVVILSAGKREGLQPGHVLKAMHHRGSRTDPVDGSYYELPDETSGLMMVFKTFRKVSYALIMEASREIQMGDLAVSP